MTRYFKALPFTIAALGIALAGHAQETAAAVNTTGAIRQIPVTDQMFRKTIWRQIDLREKQNRPMFSDGKEITRIMVDAVKRGELQPYKNDSVTSTFTSKEMLGNMSYAVEAPPMDSDDGFGPVTPANKSAAAAADPWGAPAAPARSSSTRKPKIGANGKPMRNSRGQIIYETVRTNTPATPPPPPAPTTKPYLSRDLYELTLTEEMIFDKKRSRMYHQIKTVSIVLPAALTPAGIEKPVATFKYADLVKVFRNNPQSAIWFNAQNDAQHKNLADAFELWLFNSYIIKVSNPTNEDLAGQYGGEKQGLLAAQQTAADLVEYEYNLWSF